MSRRSQQMTHMPSDKAKQHNGVAKARSTRRNISSSNRLRGGQRNEQLPFAPPEDWHEPQADRQGYQIVVQPPGPGFRHVVEPKDVRDRLSQLPDSFVGELDVIQFSRMTRKKSYFPCYGMQWGRTLYLYPLEESLVEEFHRPPQPNLVNETRMYGGRWVHEAPQLWKLIWTERTIKDFYLNNILIHELGHLLDDRNAGYVDRERYAEWFAIQYGYLPSRGTPPTQHRRRKTVRRRHHARH